MAPDNLRHLDPAAAPFLFGMMVKVKDFVALKALTITVTIAFSVGVFYTQTNAMIDKVDKFTVRLEKLENAMISMQLSQTISGNNITHIVNDLNKLTAQVGEILSNKAKIRR